jgi:hypothetical protein
MLYKLLPLTSQKLSPQSSLSTQRVLQKAQYSISAVSAPSAVKRLFVLKAK